MSQIEKYFNAEKQESILFIVIGAITILAALYLINKSNMPFNKGIACSFIAIALIQLTVGSTVYLRSPKDIERVNNIVKNEKQKIQSEEIPIMKMVMKNFVIYRWVEIVLVLTGLILFFYCQPNTFWKGAGIGLSIQATLMLILDYIAETRGKVYLEYLMKET